MILCGVFLDEGYAMKEAVKQDCLKVVNSSLHYVFEHLTLIPYDAGPNFDNSEPSH